MLKKIILAFILFLFFFQLVSWKDNNLFISPIDLEIVDNFLVKLELKIIENPDFYYSISWNLNNIIVDVSDDTRLYNIFIYIQSYLLNFYDSNYNNALGFDNPQINNLDDDLELFDWNDNDKFNKFSDLNFQNILSFNLEILNDNWLFSNVYIKNVWDNLDLNYLINEAYLIYDWLILWNWYVIFSDWYYFLHFPILNDWFKLSRSGFYEFEILVDFREPTNSNHIWEIEFIIWENPTGLVNEFYNWFRIISLSNWSLINVDVSSFRSVKKLIWSSSFFSYSDLFSPSYSILYEFVMSSWLKRLDLSIFKFDLHWSFLSSLSEDAEFRLYYNNSLFGKLYKSDVIDWRYIVFSNNWVSLDFISPFSNWFFRLELHNQWNVSWSREIRLNNVIIWDWFWWYIDNLNDYYNSWLPWYFSIYRY